MSFKDKVPGYNTLVLPYHYLQSLTAEVASGFPGKNLRIIGITGTNGKTTTSFMIWKMLNHAGYKTGLMTTVAWGPSDESKNVSLKAACEDGEQVRTKPVTTGLREYKAEKKSFFDSSDNLIKQVEHMTTVDPVTLNHRIRAIANSGAEFLVLEVTSHALAQFRTLGLNFEIAVMTNVTHEHLDYHKTFDNYLAAKCRLFKQARFGIINADDPSAKHFVSAINSSRLAKKSHPKYTSYGIKSGNIRAKNPQLTPSEIEYTYNDINNKSSNTSITPKIHLSIPGEFNVYNSLAAICVGQKLGLSPDQIATGLASLQSVEGRMNRLDLGQNFDVIVDFAHTPDAFEKVFSSVKPAKKSGRIISLFGGAGRRDESTRESRGKIAGKYSDICILTEDDSRDEDPLKIISMFEKGCKKAGLTSDQIVIVPDRQKAIAHAISLAKPGDLVLILGKGHEKTILRADGPHPFEDLKVTTAAIKKRLLDH